MLAPRARSAEARDPPAAGQRERAARRRGRRARVGLRPRRVGEVDFAVDDWLRGSVSAVLDPDGYITSHGTLRMARDYEFLADREKYGTKHPLGKPNWR